LREEILRSRKGRMIDAFMIADGAGIIAGTDRAGREAERLGLTVTEILPEGSPVREGDVVAGFHGEVTKAIAGEDVLIGLISKPSGIATAARAFVRAVGDRPRVVSGAWKKMPAELKHAIRAAVAVGGAQIRISDRPFVYLDKNYTEIFGGVAETLQAVAHLKDYEKAIQVRGKFKDIAVEAQEAVTYGAHIMFVDTGVPDDVRIVVRKVREMGARDKVRIAFGGGVKLEEIERVKSLDIDLLDIGAAIIDAPLLDLKYEVRRIH